VLLAVDLLALLIFRVLDAVLRARANVSLGCRSGLLVIDMSLPALQIAGFLGGELARFPICKLVESQHSYCIAWYSSMRRNYT